MRWNKTSECEESVRERKFSLDGCFCELLCVCFCCSSVVLLTVRIVGACVLFCVMMPSFSMWSSTLYKDVVSAISAIWLFHFLLLFSQLVFFLFFRCCSLFTLYFLFCCSSSVLFSCVFCYHSFLLLDVAFFSSSLPPICASVFPTSRHNFSFRLRSGNSKGKCRRVIENSHTGNCEWDETINMPHPQWTHTSRAMNPSNRTT